MAGGKETPRQKMIGLMYLVLMAMLAMNVSKEVINAFVTLNNNIDVANRDAIYANGKIIEDLLGKSKSPEASEKEKAEAKMWYDRAITVHNMSRNTANFFMNEANAMLAEGQPGEWVEDAGDGFLSIKDLIHHEYEKKDDYDIPTRLFVGDNHASINERGTKLKSTLENYRDSLCIMIADKAKEDGTGNYSFSPPEGLVKANQTDTAWITGLDEALTTVKLEDQAAIKEIYRILTVPEEVENHGESYPWQAGQFDHAPMAAAAAIFTGIKSKVIQAEKVALANFGEQSQAPPFTFNKIEPLSFASTAYINQGDSLAMRVMVAAYDSTADTEIRYWVDDSTFAEANMKQSGKNEVTLAGGVGDHYVYGQIAVETKSGKEWKNFKPFKYSVGSPNAAISAYDLNVLYAGWKNRLKVSAGGFDPSTVSVSCSGCDGISKEGDFWVAKASKVGKTATISVSAKDKDGKSVSLTSEEFRIFPLPKPTPKYGGVGVESSSISATIAKLGPPLQADLSGSPLNVEWKITGFEMLVVKNGKVSKLTSSSNKMTSDMKSALNTLGKGSSLTLTNIKAAGPSGKSVPIGALAFVLN